MWCWICYFRPIMALDSTIITRMDKSWKYAKIQRDQSGRIVKQIVRTSIASVDLYSAARDVGASCSVVLIRSNRKDKTVYGNPRKASRTTDGAQINWLTTLALIFWSMATQSQWEQQRRTLIERKTKSPSSVKHTLLHLFVHFKKWAHERLYSSISREVQSSSTIPHGNVLSLVREQCTYILNRIKSIVIPSMIFLLHFAILLRFARYTVWILIVKKWETFNH